jgi:glycerol kinase
MPDISALGVAFMAGLQTDVYANIEALRNLISSKKHFTPKDTESANRYYTGWLNVVNNGL